MSAVLLGNNGARRVHWGKKPLGAGVRNISDSSGHLELHGKAGDIVVLKDSDVQTHPDVNFPVIFQAIGGTVNVSFTLANYAQALQQDPAYANPDIWVNQTPIAPGSILEAPVPNFTAIRIEFAGTAEFYILGR